MKLMANFLLDISICPSWSNDIWSRLLLIV